MQLFILSNNFFLEMKPQENGRLEEKQKNRTRYQNSTEQKNGQGEEQRISGAEFLDSIATGFPVVISVTTRFKQKDLIGRNVACLSILHLIITL